MTIRFDWDPALETGIPELDIQHRELFRRANVLFAACVTGRGAEEIRSVLDFLGTHLHFRTEEALLTATGFSAVAAHARRHASLATDFQRLLRHLESVGPREHLLIRTNGFLLKELRHIKNEDLAFAPFVRAAVAARKA
ncbi:MAG: hypothetical protein HY904_07550 [Deltaproteobacteria bacterium]|nr:hypothetical protein [Deltaproteobacteria bacterium]